MNMYAKAVKKVLIAPAVVLKKGLIGAAVLFLSAAFNLPE
jgi:hypothetical protein